jgi:hypothetical protein
MKIGPFDETWFANLAGWHIQDIKPYAAYDVTADPDTTDSWIVKPPHLPDWSIHSFPQGEGLIEEIRGLAEMAKGVLTMPEPYKTKNGAELWHFIHDTRANAFGEHGEGWWAVENSLEKSLDQEGLLQPLWACHNRYDADPGAYDLAYWSNDPRASA